MIDNDKKEELKSKLGDFIRKNRPSILVRDRYDIRHELSGGDFSLFEVAPGKDERVVFDAKYCGNRGGWEISMPYEPGIRGLIFRPDIDDVLGLAAQSVRDEDLSWAFMMRNERMFAYADFKRRMKISEQDAEKLALRGVIDFCVQVPTEMDVYSFHVDSVPDVPNDKWSREKCRYYKNFTEMKHGPTLQDGYRYLIIPPAEAAALISGNVAKISRFQYAYVLGERFLTSGDRYRMPPSTIPLTDESGKFIRDGLFFGLNLKGTKYGFSEGLGYRPAPQEVTFNRDDVFVKGLVLKDFIKSAEYEKIYNRNLRRANLAADGGRDNDFKDEIKAAIDELSGGNEVGVLGISLDDVLSVFRGRVEKGGGAILRVHKTNGVTWRDRSGEEKIIKIRDIKRRLARILGYAKDYATPDFSGLD